MHRARTAMSVLLAASAAHAASLDLQLTDAQSHDSFGTFGNFASVVDVATLAGAAAGTRVDILSISWDLTVTTVVDSWMSDVTLHLDDADTLFPPSSNAVQIAPALGHNTTGSQSFADGAVLGQALVLSEGRLYLELFESFDDQPGVTEAMVSGRITIDYAVVPTPGALALLGLGLCAPARRRR